MANAFYLNNVSVKTVNFVKDGQVVMDGKKPLKANSFEELQEIAADMIDKDGKVKQGCFLSISLPVDTCVSANGFATIIRSPKQVFENTKAVTVKSGDSRVKVIDEKGQTVTRTDDQKLNILLSSASVDKDKKPVTLESGAQVFDNVIASVATVKEGSTEYNYGKVAMSPYTLAKSYKAAIEAYSADMQAEAEAETVAESGAEDVLPE